MPTIENAGNLVHVDANNHVQELVQAATNSRAAYLAEHGSGQGSRDELGEVGIVAQRILDQTNEIGVAPECLNTRYGIVALTLGQATMLSGVLQIYHDRSDQDIKEGVEELDGVRLEPWKRAALGGSALALAKEIDVVTGSIKSQPLKVVRS